MDQRLVAWARGVKARRRSAGPVLWLFTDWKRVPDPLPVIARLPKGLCGVVFRHEGVAGRVALARAVAKLCRARRLYMTVSGDWRLAAALGAGVHVRGGRGCRRLGKVNTASAHTVVELRRARRAGALVFLSPVFATASHPGMSELGARRWAAMAGGAGAGALGGMTGSRARRLGRSCLAVGAIAAFA